MNRRNIFFIIVFYQQLYKRPRNNNTAENRTRSNNCAIDLERKLLKKKKPRPIVKKTRGKKSCSIIFFSFFINISVCLFMFLRRRFSFENNRSTVKPNCSFFFLIGRSVLTVNVYTHECRFYGGGRFARSAYVFIVNCVGSLAGTLSWF